MESEAVLRLTTFLIDKVGGLGVWILSLNSLCSGRGPHQLQLPGAGGGAGGGGRREGSDGEEAEEEAEAAGQDSQAGEELLH